MLSIEIVLAGSSLMMFSETLNDLIFGIKYSFPAPTGPGCTLVANPAKESSHLVSQFDNTDCYEEFITPLSCFPHPWCNSSL